MKISLLIRLTATLSFAAAICGCSKSSAEQISGSAPHPTIADIVKSYGSYQSVTAQPVFVDPAMLLSCVGASQAQVDAARAKFGPHANAAISIYMNDAAATAFYKQGSYPVGAVVVKCKKLLGYRGQSGTWHSEIENGVGGMVKREAGYDSAHGNWEYFYFEDPSHVESGRITSCVQCHDSAKKSDYVFGSWLHGVTSN